MLLKKRGSVDELTKGDFFYLLYWARTISYGSVYNIESTCTKCGSDIKTKIDLQDFPITYLTEVVERLR